MNILIVDDEAAARRDLEKVLHRVTSDPTIYHAQNAKGALDACEEYDIDVAFVDIRMPQKNGLSLAEEIRNIAPGTNIVIVSAYPEYALEAHRLFVSGYILKPVMEDEIRDTLINLRNPIRSNKHGLYVRCFGNFEVFYDGKPLSFGRSKSKELFAYLIDLQGAAATNAECCATLWGDAADGSARQRDYFHHIWSDLKGVLEEADCADVLSYSRNSYAVNPDMIKCDYYEAISEGVLEDLLPGEYMRQYSWAEGRLRFKNRRHDTVTDTIPSYSI